MIGVEHWILLAGSALILALAMVVAGMLWLIHRGPPAPPEIPREDRRLFRAAFVACRRDLQVGAWGSFPPGLQRFDARVYAAAYVMIRDLYLADTTGLSRAERELVATAASVANLCYYCTHNHAALLSASTLSGVEELVLNRSVGKIEDPRLQTLADLALRSKQPADIVALARDLTPEELADIASVLFTFNYVNRVVDVVGPTTGLPREIFAKPPPPVIAAMLGLNRSWRAGGGLRALGAARGHVEPQASDHDHRHIRRWTLGRPERTESVLFVWAAIQGAAQELFDAEVLDAIRAHLADWHGGEFPLTEDWQTRYTAALSSKANQSLAGFGILVARCAYRVSAQGMLEACGGDRRRRLVLVAYAACAAALRSNEWLPIEEEVLTHPGQHHEAVEPGERSTPQPHRLSMA